ncbi:MAG: CPBP family intramembrane metalloprotease [Clostridia bacterium]|nr:CPBP family intramembrane metalloprotease [Clostridia bacterium]
MDKLNKLYNKSELEFSIFFIVVYIVGASLCDFLSDMVGISKLFTFPFLLAMSVLLYVWIKQNNFMEKYGLCKPKFTAKSFLFYIPLVVLISTNVWFGVRLNYNLIESILNVLAMLCVGFAEEIIFRGFLFRAMEKDNVKTAIIVSSVTFGIGHIINLFSSGFSNILSNVCQVFYAMAVGFLFVIIFYKGGSLLSCILTHSLVNALSVFQNVEVMSGVIEIVVSLVIIVVAALYSIVLLKTLKQDALEVEVQNEEEKVEDLTLEK